MKDIKIQEAIELERKRQLEHIELIASENFVSEDVLKATGSILTNKYAEGYAGARYYDGTEYVDIVENLAIDRIKQLFGVKHANVQPHSGSSANAAAVASVVKPGGKIMGLALEDGGHLTHGYKISFSGAFFQSASYHVDENGLLDYDEIERQVVEFKPDLLICGYSAYSREFDFKRFKEIADKVGAKLMADIAHIAGLIAAGQHPSPVGYADIITTTTHKTLRGARGGVIMTNDDEIAKKINRWVFPGFQGGPLMHSIAGKAVAFNEALQPEFKEYITRVKNNSKVFCEELQSLGAKIISGGTDNHLFIVDVKSSYGITGQEASTRLQKNNITVNKNTIPNETLSPKITSGIRLGTAAMTTRGFTEENFRKLARLIHSVLTNDEDIKEEVRSWVSEFPMFKW